MVNPNKFRFSIDRGGTFTDVYAEVPKKDDNDTGFRVLKLLSEDPSYDDAPREAIRRILESETGDKEKYAKDNHVDTSLIENIRMGTTVATNALLERKGERIAFVTTAGFRDILYIGNQSRPKIFDLRIDRPEVLYEEVVEIEERIRVISEQGTAKNKEQRDAEIDALRDIAVRDFLTNSSQINSEVSLDNIDDENDENGGNDDNRQNNKKTKPDNDDDKSKQQHGESEEKQSRDEDDSHSEERKEDNSGSIVDDAKHSVSSALDRVKETASDLLNRTTGNSQSSSSSLSDRDVDSMKEKIEVVGGLTNEQVVVLKVPDRNKVRKQLQRVYEKGIKSLAVALCHSYTYNKHEKLVGEIAKEIGFTHVSLSSELMAMVKIVPRGYTACADAYLTPCIQRYLHHFSSGFDENFSKNVHVAFMQSDGGLTTMNEFSGHRAVLSGPAGGVVGYARTTYLPDSETGSADQANDRTNKGSKEKKGKKDDSDSDADKNSKRKVPVIGFDMGGTSTDVSRYDGKQYEHVMENTIAGVALMTPQLDINTVAAGGGSQLFFRNGLFVVGPESAGANPGPACYKRGGPLTITDANLLLKRLIPENFPSIFGPNRDEPLDPKITKEKFDQLTKEINDFFSKSSNNKSSSDSDTGGSSGSSSGKKGKADMSPEEVALGFLTVANESMCRPIRALTQAKGYDVQQHILSSFGGAGGQHASSIAKDLGITHVFIHRLAGILSAYGLALSDIVVERQEPCAMELKESNQKHITQRIEHLIKEATEKLQQQGFEKNTIKHTVFLNLRYTGTDTSVMTSIPEFVESKHDDEKESTSSFFSSSPRHSVKRYMNQFLEQYKREYGFTLDRTLLLDDVRVRAIGKSDSSNEKLERNVDPDKKNKPLKKESEYQAYFEGGWHDTSVYELSNLDTGFQITGPSIIIDQTSTILVEPNNAATVTDEGSVHIVVKKNKDNKEEKADKEKQNQKQQSNSSHSTTSEDGNDDGDQVDSIQLSVFAHRFMSIAEQMGRTLQRTSISTNIKERLDFSCAIFDSKGGLVANAPHLPVHLGAMQDAVRWQVELKKHHQEKWRNGDVFVSNHPRAGGSHLPDITVITPVLESGVEEGDSPLFYVASRGHHSDVGGISPGSMPPFSKTLWDEGAAIKSFKLVSKGKFEEDGIRALLKCEKLDETEKIEEKDKPKQKLVGTRNINDNVSDLRAQIAANKKGINLIYDLIEEYGRDTVLLYMGQIQKTAELAVRNMLKDLAKKHKLKQPVDTLHAVDYMDDGTPVKLALTINSEKGTAIFDFTGTGAEMFANLNAPPAVTKSAIIYCLRCLVNLEIPLNQGCLAPIDIHIPRGTFLNASEYAAVVGGNVLTSQRVTDIVLKAFQACAASQGCMNNLTFGDETFGYYETIAGGAGAGDGWTGQSGVHTHMTNCFPADDHQVLTRHGYMYLHEVTSHLDAYGVIDIACYVNGELQYHSIGIEQVVVADGTYTLVEMCEAASIDKLGRNKMTSDVSLTPTSNHRMYARLGRTIGKSRQWPHSGGRSDRSRTAPPFAIHTAEQVVSAGASDTSTVIQFKTHFEHGYVATPAMHNDNNVFKVPAPLHIRDVSSPVSNNKSYRQTSISKFISRSLSHSHSQSFSSNSSNGSRGDRIDLTVDTDVTSLLDTTHIDSIATTDTSPPSPGSISPLATLSMRPSPSPLIHDAEILANTSDNNARDSDVEDMCKVIEQHQALPFVDVLGLETDDEIDAFIELIGYWLGDGWLMVSSQAVSFGPAKLVDWDYLDNLFIRLSRVLPRLQSKKQQGGVADILYGVYIEPRPDVPVSATAGPQRDYYIYTPSWFTYFSVEYIHKYKDYKNIKRLKLKHLSDVVAENIRSAKWLMKWMLQLDSRRARLVLKGLRFADGDESVGSTEGGQIGTSSARFRDEILQLATHAGYSVVYWLHTEKGHTKNKNRQGKDIIARHWKVSYSVNQRRIQPRLHVQTQCKTIQYTGKVWCVSVPTQLIMVRRVLRKFSDGSIREASRGVIVGNTRITDVEIIERRYPVLMRQFTLRPNSGGAGKYRGGDGVIRDLQFLKTLDMGILSERRAYHPFGLAGGSDAKCGINLIVTRDGRVLTLGPKNTYPLRAGDRFRVLTPGGGGYGSHQDKGKDKDKDDDDRNEDKPKSESSHPATMLTRLGSGSVAQRESNQLSA